MLVELASPPLLPLVHAVQSAGEVGHLAFHVGDVGVVALDRGHPALGGPFAHELGDRAERFGDRGAQRGEREHDDGDVDDDGLVADVRAHGPPPVSRLITSVLVDSSAVRGLIPPRRASSRCRPAGSAMVPMERMPSSHGRWTYSSPKPMTNTVQTAASSQCAAYTRRCDRSMPTPRPSAPSRNPADHTHSGAAASIWDSAPVPATARGVR